jgi:hypothetical protein
MGTAFCDIINIMAQAVAFRKQDFCQMFLLCSMSVLDLGQ